MKKILLLLVIFFPLIAEGQGCYQDFLQEGIAAFNAFDYPTAIKKFESAKICPDKPSDQEAEDWIDKTNRVYIEKLKKIVYKYLLTEARAAENKKEFRISLRLIEEAQKVLPEEPQAKKQLEELKQFLVDRQAENIQISPDGKRLAYVKKENNGRKAVVIENLESGRDEHNFGDLQKNVFFEFDDKWDKVLIGNWKKLENTNILIFDLANDQSLFSADGLYRFGFRLKKDWTRLAYINEFRFPGHLGQLNIVDLTNAEQVFVKPQINMTKVYSLDENWKRVAYAQGEENGDAATKVVVADLQSGAELFSTQKMILNFTVLSTGSDREAARSAMSSQSAPVAPKPEEVETADAFLWIANAQEGVISANFQWVKANLIDINHFQLNRTGKLLAVLAYNPRPGTSIHVYDIDKKEEVAKWPDIHDFIFLEGGAATDMVMWRVNRGVVQKTRQIQNLGAAKQSGYANSYSKLTDGSTSEKTSGILRFSNDKGQVAFLETDTSAMIHELDIQLGTTGDKELILWDILNRKVNKRIAKFSPTAYTLSDDFNSVLITHLGDDFQAPGIYGSIKGKEVDQKLDPGICIWSPYITISSNNQHVAYLTDADCKTIVIAKTSDPKPLRKAKAVGSIEKMYFSNNGKYLVAKTQKNDLLIKVLPEEEVLPYYQKVYPPLTQEQRSLYGIDW